MTDKVYDVSAKWEKIIRMGWRFKSQSNTLVRTSECIEGMSTRQLDILVVLECLKVNTISEMASILKISKSTLSIIMNKLVAKGFVVKKYPDGKDDGRRVYFYISDKGKEIFKKIGRVQMQGINNFFKNVEEDRKRLFSEGIAYLVKATEAKDTLFATMLESDEDFDCYGEELVQLAKDFVYFILSIKIHKLDEIRTKLQYSITQNQFHLILCVASGLDNLTKLEKHLGSSGSTLSISISKMVDKGLLYKEYPKINDDGRKVYIRLTPFGEEMLNKARNFANQYFIEFLSGLSDEKLEFFDKGCDCLLKSFKNL